MSSELKTHALGLMVARLYPKLPLRGRWLRIVVSAEGGQFRSATLRRILADHHGVVVGPHSYGSLLDPGMCDARTTIGSYVSIGPNVRRFGAAHPTASLSMHPYWYNPALGHVGMGADVPRSSCVIEDEVWIGANAIVLHGCRRIGIGAVVGAAAVVTRDVPDFAVVAGNPARVIAERLSADERTAVRRAVSQRLPLAELQRVWGGTE